MVYKPTSIVIHEYRLVPPRKAKLAKKKAVSRDGVYVTQHGERLILRNQGDATARKPAKRKAGR